MLLFLASWSALSTAQTASQTGNQSADSLVTKRATVLRDGPGDAARELQSLAAQTVVKKLPERAGPWVRVQLEGQTAAASVTGWLHVFDLATANHASTSSVGTTVSNAATGFLRGVTGLFNKGSTGQGTTVATATVGIRGLGAEDLANAQPNMAAVDQMDARRADAAAAQRFGTALGLRPQKLDWLAANGTGGTSGTSGTESKSAEVAR